MVCPSASADFTEAMAMSAAAAAIFDDNGLADLLRHLLEDRAPTRSTALPAENGTITRTDLVGQSCAARRRERRYEPERRRRAKAMRFIDRSASPAFEDGVHCGCSRAD